MKQHKFFAQSCRDALDDYMYSCTNTKSDRWDWVILTAADQRQAEAYRIQIANRAKENRLPKGVRFEVIPDYQNKRIGSGGATLNVLRHINHEIGADRLLQQKILVIHSGGDSKRIPQYSACGKLFAPVPRMLPNGYISSVFDELLIAATDIPNRCAKGMMIFPGDTELLFNSLQLDLLSCDAAGLSIKAPVLEGQEHGVFLQGHDCSDRRNYDVDRFLHKQSEALLREAGAVDALNQVDIDTGCIWISSRIIKALFELICTNGEFDREKFDSFVNPKVCLNFYSDFVYPLAAGSSLEEFYREMPENGYSPELKECRRKLWDCLHEYRLSLVKMVPARYIHFGTTQELYELLVDDMDEYFFLGWERRLGTNAGKGTVINSFISEDTLLTDHCYIEDSVIYASTIGENTVLSNIEAEGMNIPANVVLHGLQLKNGSFVCRIYGRSDNPKASANAPFLHGTLTNLIENTGADRQAIWERNAASIWNARIYPECPTMIAAVKAALALYEILKGTALPDAVRRWKAAEKHSLCGSFYDADVPAIMERRRIISKKVFVDSFLKRLKSGNDMTEMIGQYSAAVFPPAELVRELLAEAEQASFPDNMRLYLACSDICKKYEPDGPACSAGEYEEKAYAVVRETIRREILKRFHTDFPHIRFVRDSVTVELPVRVNFCGSPSDAAPYCLEHGGTMLDSALLLNGKKPIKVTVNRIKECEIRFGSSDQGCKDSFTDLEEIRNCGNPYDPYALHKSVLAAAGILPLDAQNTDIHAFCRQLGGGLELLTEAAVPKGSGLGTSSIIAAAAVKAVNQICGIEASDEMVYGQVFLAEQLMTTGGGWQDQVGGLTEGIKYFTALPGTYQEIQVEHLRLPDKVMEELNDRFALIFSGQRRLARNVLREEMNQCIRNNPEALRAVEQLQEYCAVMRYFLRKGDITSFAKYITKQFELVKRLDKGASNTCIEYIFDVCDDLLDGRSICGAGGGGFLQVILKKDVTKEMLKDRIRDAFADCGVEVWDCRLI